MSSQTLQPLERTIANTTFEVVQTFPGPAALTNGQIVYGSCEYHRGVGHTATLPDGGRLTITPGGRDTYGTAGYFLATFDARGARRGGQQFSNVHAALAKARTELRNTR
jgi:hypothetical protein